MIYQDGFLISTHTQVNEKCTQIILWVQTEFGPAKLYIENERYIFFLPNRKADEAIQILSKENTLFEFKRLSLTDFKYNPITVFYFSQFSDFQQANMHLTKLGFDLLEADIRLIDRYLMERFICGGLTFSGQPKRRFNYTEYKNVQVKRSDFACALSRVSLDIECSENGVLYSIGLFGKKDQRVIMIEPEHQSRDVSQSWIEWVDSEADLLHALNQWFAIYDPDVVIGWNVIDFDFRLIHQRAEKIGVPLRLGRGQEKSYWRESIRIQKGFISIPGRVVIDGIDALKTATYSFRSWSLEWVAQTLLKKGKLIKDPYDRMDSINQMYREQKVSLAHYNLIDCQLVDDIFEKTHLLDFLIQRTRLTGVALDRIGGSVAAFTNLYLPRLHRAGFVAPTLDTSRWLASPGGYVMNSKPGLYHSVLVLDFKSLYPSIIRTFLIDPMGLIEGLHASDRSQTVEGFLGGRFHKEKHFLPALITSLWQARDEAKLKGQKAFSQAIKIIMNSFYGVLGSSGCRFFDQKLASSITMRGHEIMKTTRKLIEKHGYEVIYGDTDSTFVSIGRELTNAEADHIGAKLIQYINQWWANHVQSVYQVPSYLELEYETHYQRFLMPTIRGQETGSKKRYAGLIVRNGQKNIVFKGLESVRTDWTPLAQEFQQNLYQRIFDGENVIDYVRNVVQQTLSGQLDDKLIYRKRLRRVLADYQKNVPPHVKAARKADELNKKRGRPLQYQKGGWIEYVITINGPEPIEGRESLIDHQHYVTKQLKPVADGILPFIGESFDAITTIQKSLF